MADAAMLSPCEVSQQYTKNFLLFTTCPLRVGCLLLPQLKLVTAHLPRLR
jgi:hypothetical protein